MLFSTLVENKFKRLANHISLFFSLKAICKYQEYLNFIFQSLPWEHRNNYWPNIKNSLKLLPRQHPSRPLY